MAAIEALRSVLDAVPTALGIHAREARAAWRYVNPAMRKMLGYTSPDALVGVVTLELLGDDTEQRGHVERRQHALLRGETIGFNVTRWRRRDGTFVPVEVSAAQVEFEEAPAVLVVARDLTERAALQDRLALADRMVSIGTLAAGVAHEINNPLTYIMLGLEMLGREIAALPPGPATDRLRALGELVAGMYKGAERMQHIVRAMKTFSHASEEGRKRIDVREVMNASIDIVANEIKHRARLSKSYDEVPPVMADEARIGQVFINLLVNAAQAIPEGRAEQNEIRVATRVVDGQVRVEVGDTGRGIPSDVLPRIFDPFFTTKAIGEGMGLGLAICHGIMRAHSGDITVTSEPGRTTFVVTLPVAEATTTPAVAPVKAFEPAAGTTRRRVLVIDDDPMVAASCRAVLRSEFDVTTFNEARAALEKIARGERFDAIVCDLMMPEMTGMEFFTELVRVGEDHASRVIFITGGAFTPAAHAFIAETRAPVLEKPFASGELRDAVRRIAVTS